MTRKERFYRLLNDGVGVHDLRVRSVRGGVLAMSAEAAEFVLRLGSIAILARMLMPEHFGLIGMVTAITAIAERFKDFGLAAATVQKPEITYEQVTALFWVNAAIGLGVALMIAGLGVPIARFYDDERLVNITLAIASTFILSGMITQHQALLRRNLRFGRLAVTQVIASILSIVVAVVLAVRGYGYWALVAREASRAIFITIGTWVSFPWVPGWSTDRAGVRKMLGFGGDVSLFNLIWYLASNFDQIVIGKLFGAGPLGLYRQGVNFALGPISQLSFPVNSVAETTLSRLHDDPDRYRRYYRSILTAMCVLTMPLAGYLAVFAEELVAVLLGPGWTDATIFFRLLAIAVFIKPAASTAGFVMVTSGKSRRYVYWGLVYAVGLVAFVLLGSLWGPAGIAGAHVATSYLLLVPLLYWAFRETPLRIADFWVAAIRPIVSSLVMIGAACIGKWVLRDSGALSSLLVGALVAGGAFLTTYLLIPGGRAELTREIVNLRSIMTKA